MSDKDRDLAELLLAAAAKQKPKPKRGLTDVLLGMLGAWLWSIVRPYLDQVPLRWKVVGGLVLVVVLAFVADLPELAWPVLLFTVGLVVHTIRQRRRGPVAHMTGDLKAARASRTLPGTMPVQPALPAASQEEEKPLQPSRVTRVRARVARARARKPVQRVTWSLQEAERLDDLRRRAALARQRGERAHKGGKRRRTTA